MFASSIRKTLAKIVTVTTLFGAMLSATPMHSVAAKTQAAPAQSIGCGTIYYVQRGDTLSNIARRLGLGYRWQWIRDRNQIVGTRLRVGQMLCIPTPEPFRYFETHQTNTEYVYANNNLNIRVSPGIGFDRVEKVFAGQTFIVNALSLDGKWWRVPCPPHDAIDNCFVTADPRYSQIVQ